MLRVLLTPRRPRLPLGGRGVPDVCVSVIRRHLFPELNTVCSDVSHCVYTGFLIGPALPLITEVAGHDQLSGR